MFTWPHIIGVLLLGLAAYQLIRGRFSTSDDNGRGETIDRDKNPFTFWFTVTLEIAIGLLMLVGVIKF
ncbi:MAG TPA: hypothetical protein VIU38_14535 [Anaerolineales bacterium]